MQTIYPCLWFDSNAEEAVDFYLSVFPNSKILEKTFYTDVGKEIHGKDAGEVLTIEFELMGNRFTALNGGPEFTFSQAMSLQVFCDTQEQIDQLWGALSADPEAEACGCLKDRYGVSWQIVPNGLDRLLSSEPRHKANAAMAALLEMKKLDMAELKRAFDEAELPDGRAGQGTASGIA